MEWSTSLIDLTPLFLLLLTPWIWLALVSAFTDAGVGYIDEYLLRRLAEADERTIDAPGRLVLISGFFGIVVSAGIFVFIIATNSYTLLNVSTQSYVAAFGAGVLEVMWLIPYFYALQRGGAISTTPLFQTVPIFALIIGLLFFQEVPIATHVFATVCIIAGAVVLNYSPKKHHIDGVTLGLMLLSSLIISFGFFLFKDAAITGNFTASLLGNGLGMTAVSTCIWLLWPPYRHQFNTFLRRFDWRVLSLQFANEGLYTVSALTNQLAVVLGPSVMIVSALNAFHPIFTLLIGWTLALGGSTTHQQKLRGTGLRRITLAILLIAFGTILIGV